MRWRILLTTLLTIAVLLGSACGTEDNSADGNPAASPGAEDAAAESKVEVVARGAEPHAIVEYALTKGQRQTATMRMDMAMAMSGGGQNFDFSIPTMVMDMALEVLEVTDDGYVIRTEFVGARLEPGTPEQEQIAASMRGAMDAMAGITGTMTMTPHGEVIDFDMEVPDNVPAEMQATIEQMNASMEQLAAPFPPAGVGVGARWRVPQTLDTDAMKMEQVVEYHLVRLEENTAELEYTFTQTAPRQTMEGGVELLEMTGSGTGTMTVNLNALVPRSDADATTGMVLQTPGSGGGPPQELKQNVTMSMELIPT